MGTAAEHSSYIFILFLHKTSEVSLKEQYHSFSKDFHMKALNFFNVY